VNVRPKIEYSCFIVIVRTMEFIPADAQLFRAAIDAMKDYLPQTILRISSDGLRISGMDTSHVGYVDYFLTAADCTKLVAKKPIEVGMNLVVLSRVLGSVGSGDTVTLSLKGEKIIVEFQNTKAAKKALYEINTLDIESESHELPDISYDANVSVKTTDIASVIKEVGAFGDDITFMMDEEGFHISAKGDFGSAKQTLDKSEGREMAIKCDSVSAKFGTKYLIGLFKSCSCIATTTQIDFDTDKPMRCMFRFGAGSSFTSYLAPKIMDT